MRELASRQIVVCVEPAHGMTITSIIDRRTGIDLMWHEESPGALTPNIGPAGPISRDTFDETIMIGGWFPMFPTAGGPGSRKDLWLHGEATRVEWNTDSATAETLLGNVTLPASNLSMARRIEVSGRTVTVATVVSNATSERAMVTAGEHPCFDIEALDISALDIGAGPVKVPQDDKIAHHPGYATGRAEIHSEALGGVVALEWDQDQLPGLMVWRRGREVLALEPKSFVGRSADDVGESWWTIEPGASRQWWMRIRIESLSPSA